MKHLRALQLVNTIAAAFYATVGVLLVPLCLGILHLFAVDVPADELAGLHGGLALGTAICLGLAGFTFVMGRRVAAGRWRWAQTISAVMSAANNPPLGLAYAAYAMWVCWANPESRGAVAPPV